MPIPPPPVCPHIRLLVPYRPGKPIEEVQRELGLTDVVKLASNENPLGPSSRAVAAMRRAARSVALYPDGKGASARVAPARKGKAAKPAARKTRKPALKGSASKGASKAAKKAVKPAAKKAVKPRARKTS